MRNFSEYVKASLASPLYHMAKRYAKPDHFMSFREATWERTSKTQAVVPNGIIVYNIVETMHQWQEYNDVMVFPKAGPVQKKIFILKANQTGGEYTKYNLDEDLLTLESTYNFKPNKKLVSNLKRAGLKEEARKELHKFETMVSEATAHLSKPSEMLMEVTKWIAAGNKNPYDFFPDNAPQRWNNILRKLGYTCLAEGDTAIFLDTNAFEVIDEQVCN